MKGIEAAVDTQKCLLHDFPGVLLIPKQAEGNRVRPPLVALHQLLEGELVAFLSAFDEYTVLFRFELSALSV